MPLPRPLLGAPTKLETRRATQHLRGARVYLPLVRRVQCQI